MSEGQQAPRRSLAEKIDHLFAAIHPAGRGSYSYKEVEAGIRERGGPPMSASYIWQLRTGKRDNPTMKHLEALAGFFGVSPSYFFDEEASRRIDAELSMLATMRDSRVRSVAMRASDLSPETLKLIEGFIERARDLEGLNDGKPSPENRP
ncbi:helix-turn-helix domain-containing protein [Streptomyces calidiresistens]|uniref:XRE family transcriptional regulator n=1 Tax=Streptomyces calidiresistens TaxID=1485586 RepID=A0A7W3SZK0_9ACTN|nr:MULTISPECIES: helix-turn-helix domain-containing protein [Streptomyces]MBB0228209.1 XRE family transcriptional regulator [Streptomyces calidiresistens]MCE7080143.1 helix-turn-helix domain-containing protein [Streptomyces sp. ST2-7A]